MLGIGNRLPADREGGSRRHTTADIGLPHRLGHQPLDHFPTATNHGRLTWHTDFDPTGVYEIDYSALEHRTEFQNRSSGNLIVGVNYRRLEREGIEQSTTISHCDSCHVVSQARPIDEVTTDMGLDATVFWGANSLKASFLSRALE